jgi:hypothetical protein
LLLWFLDDHAAGEQDWNDREQTHTSPRFPDISSYDAGTPVCRDQR